MKNSFLLIAISLLFTSCAGTFQYTKVATQNKSEMATIYVIRPSSYGTSIKYRIYQDGELIGKLGPKSYLAWNVEPKGEDITIQSRSENKDMLVINPQPGKTYYIRQKVKLGIAFARTGLEFLSDKEGKELINKLKSPNSKYAE